MFKIKCSTRYLKARNFYHLRFKVYRRYQKPIFKIVVVKPNNRIVYTLGYFNPFKINFRESYRDVSQPLFTAKTVFIDREKTIAWLRMGLIPSIPLCYLLNDVGLLKTRSSNPSKIVDEFDSFRVDTYKLLSTFSDILD
jgi:ribosomal protein S16